MKLNLVLHGLFACVVTDSRNVELWVPSYAEHDYQWEEWGAKTSGTPISGDGAVHELSGIGGGRASLAKLQPKFNTVLKTFRPQAIPGLHCIIKLPFPEEISSLRKVCKHRDPDEARRSPAFFSGDAVKCMHQVPDEIAMVHVFEYTITDLHKLTYEHKPVAAPSGGKQRVRLHIWADPSGGGHAGNGTTPVEKTIESMTGQPIKQEGTYLNRLGALNRAAPRPLEMEFPELYNRYERRSPPPDSECDSADMTLMRMVTCMQVFAYNV